jgi:hypothetical protein
MLSDYLIAPSLNSLFVTGMLLFFILIIIVRHFAEFMRLPMTQKLVVLSLISIALGSHGMLHLGAEYVYGFNPYKWF